MPCAPDQHAYTISSPLWYECRVLRPLRKAIAIKGPPRAAGAMSQCLLVGFARLFMATRECIAPDRTHELSERAVCDLNACLEQLVMRRDEVAAALAPSIALL